MVKAWKRIEPTIVTKIDRREVVLKTFMQPGVAQPKVFATFLSESSRSAAVIAITGQGQVEFLGTSCRDAYTNGTRHYYLATDCQLSADGQDLDEFEDIEVALISIDQLLRNAMQDKLTDPHAILLAYERLQAIRQELVGSAS